ncbi:phage shock protein PspD [Morganella psychrotolerans]|uniref:phage shock protein PspD n=1 Tax=Morganella psychrotolerans TaxID=368603 RepID=UPI0039AFBD84
MKLKNKQILLRFGKTGLRLFTSAALMAAPAGIAGAVLKSVTRQPLRGLVLLALEPVLRAGMEKLTRHLPWEKHETTAK